MTNKKIGIKIGDKIYSFDEINLDVWARDFQSNSDNLNYNTISHDFDAFEIIEDPEEPLEETIFIENEAEKERHYFLKSLSKVAALAIVPLSVFICILIIFFSYKFHSGYGWFALIAPILYMNMLLLTSVFDKAPKKEEFNFEYRIILVNTISADKNDKQEFRLYPIERHHRYSK